MDSYFVQWTVEIAVAICAIETITGLLALRKKYAPIVSIVFLGMMSFFVWLTGINLFYPSLMGSIESCGCFGELIHFSPLASFVKSVVLWGMAVMNYELRFTNYLLSFFNSRKPWRNILRDGTLYVTLVIGALPPLYSYLFFENMEHGYYLVGYISLCVLGGGLCLVFRD